MGNVLLTWVIILLVYAYIASTLPVWMLLQPRDYINTHELIFGLGVLYLALFIGHPPVVAPAINPNPVGAPRCHFGVPLPGVLGDFVEAAG